MLDEKPAGSKIAEVRVSPLATNVVGTLLTLLFCLAGVFVAHLLPHYTPFRDWHPVALLVSLVALMPIHEGLHAVGLVQFAKVSRKHIRFGMMWRALMPYCYCLSQIPLRAYRRQLLLPLIVTGLAALTALILFPTDWLGLLAGIVVAASVADMWVVLKLRRFADDCLIQDSPTAIGGDVYSETPSPPL